MPEKPIALDAYEQLAESYAAMVSTKPHNAYYERPATHALLPALDGLSVLDAGCGPGVAAEIMIEKGAQLTGIDSSPKMLELAKQRLGDRAALHRADMEEPLDFLRSGSFDVVVSSLAISYVRYLGPLFSEFYRLLRDGGVLVFSTAHPHFDFSFYKSDDYFATEQVGCNWHGFGTEVYVPCYRRPLCDVVNPLIQAGFRIEQLVEPLPTREFEQADPEGYQKLLRQPSFMCVRASKPEQTQYVVGSGQPTHISLAPRRPFL